MMNSPNMKNLKCLSTGERIKQNVLGIHLAIKGKKLISNPVDGFQKHMLKKRSQINKNNICYI